MNPFQNRNKYHARKVNICGIDFDSKKEGMRYLLLNDMARQGQIKGVKVGDLWFINSDSLCDALGID